MDKINKFRGSFFFLSNFYEAPITYENITYRNNEAAFQAQKTLDIELRKEFSSLSPNEAKRKGRKLKLRDDWDLVRVNIMREICLAKFTQNTELGEKLINTGDLLLEEDNNWGDTFWGVVDGTGFNMLGNILMSVREDIKRK